MTRTLQGIVLAFASLAASAGPAGAPVTVQNVPLPVTVQNAPLAVNPTQAVIPFAKLDGLRPPIWCMVRRTTDRPPWSESNTCTDAAPVTLSDRFLIYNIIYEPASAAYPMDEEYRAASCSVMYWLSVNGSSQRVGMMTWSPGQFQSIVLPFPVPIEIPAGSTVVQRLDVTMNGGQLNQGCNVAVSAIGAHD